MVNLHLSNCGQYGLISAIKGNDGKSLLYIADLKDERNVNLDKPLVFKNVSTDWIGVFNYITNKGKDFYFQTNVDAPKNRVIKMNIDTPEKSKWVDIIPESPKSVLTSSMCSNHDYIVANYMQDATEKLWVYNMDSPAKMVSEI
jgi:prolyl oligopeptidase